MAKLTKRQKREVDMRVLMEQARAHGEEWKYVLLSRKFERERVPVTTYDEYTPEMLDYFGEQRRVLRNARKYGGTSRHLDASFSEGHLFRVFSDIVVMNDSRLRHPLWAEYLLYLLLPKSEREVVAGDLIEEFRATIVPKFGPRAARFWFLKQVFSSIWPLLKQRVLRALGILAASKYLWRS